MVSEMDPGSTVRQSEMRFHQSEISRPRMRMPAGGTPIGASAHGCAESAALAHEQRRRRARRCENSSAHAKLRTNNHSASATAALLHRSAQQRLRAGTEERRQRQRQRRLVGSLVSNGRSVRCARGAPVSDGALSYGALTGRGARSALHHAHAPSHPIAKRRALSTGRA